MLDGDRAHAAGVGAGDRMHVNEAQAECRSLHEEVLRARRSLARDVGGPAAPGAREAHVVVHGDRDVAGMRASGTKAREKIEQSASGIRTRREPAHGQRIVRDGGRDLRQRADHLIEFLAHERLDAAGRRAVGRPEPPPLERSAGGSRERGSHETAHEQATPAHAPVAKVQGRHS